MPAPAVYILAVVGTVGAVFAFRHFVYEPHLAPKIEQWAEEYIARRRARRMQRQGPIPVPASIPLRRRRGSRSSQSDPTPSDSDSGDDANQSGPSNRGGNSNQPSGSRRNGNGRSPKFDGHLASEVSEWRSKVEQNRTAPGLRHRTNINAYVMDQPINSIPHAAMSPTHVIADTSAPTTPSTTTIPSRLPSPPPQVSPIQSGNSDSTLRLSTSGHTSLPGPSPLSQDRTPPSASPRGAFSHPNLASPSQSANTGPGYSPPASSSPIPSLSQAYPQELDRERGVELLSPPSSGTSSPFSTFSPFVAPQALSPFAAVQPLDHPTSPGIDPSSPGAFSRTLSPSQHTVTSPTQSNYQSLSASPGLGSSNLSSPVNVARAPLRSPSPRGDLSYLSSPSPINFVSPPTALSPRSPPSDISDLEFGSDIEVLSDPGSDGSDRSWAGISSDVGSQTH